VVSDCAVYLPRVHSGTLCSNLGLIETRSKTWESSPLSQDKPLFYVADVCQSLTSHLRLMSFRALKESSQVSTLPIVSIGHICEGILLNLPRFDLIDSRRAGHLNVILC